MARNKENKNIDDIDYVCTMMPATMANKVLVELMGTLGQPALVAIASAFSSDGESQIDAIADAATRAIMQRLSPEDADRVCKMVLHGVRCTENAGNVNESDVFDEHFRGRIFHLWKVVAWSIQVNYRDFFYAANSNPTVSGLLKKLSSGASMLTAILSSGDASSSESDLTSET